MVAPIANLFDDFNSGTINSTKWTSVVATSAASGQLCATVPTSGAVTSTSAWSLQQSAAFLEAVNLANGAGATGGQTLFRIFSTADTTDFVEFQYNAATNALTMRWFENNVVQTTSTVTYNSTTMRWLRIRESSTTIYFETAPDGSTWTTRFTTTSQSWVSSVKVTIYHDQTGGTSTTKCIDNFNVASASARAVAVGSEFTVSTDGKLGLDRCDQPDQASAYGCSMSAFNGIRRSSDPCGLWVQPPAEQLVQVENQVLSTSDNNEQTIITLTLTNPDTCRSMLFYLPLTGGMKMASTKSDSGGVVSWTLGVQVTGVDNPDSGFSPLVADDLGWGANVLTHLWRGTSDYFWTAAPGASTTIVVKLKAFSGDTGVKLAQLQARLGIIGMSVVV